MKINEVAKLTGVTVRTLHYYDEIGLLKPEEVTAAGYRIYGKAQIEKLQQILFFRELDFPLDDIKEIMSNSHYDKRGAFEKQRVLLIKKRERLDRLIELVEKTMKGEENMNFKEFDMTEIEEIKKKYADEVKERWGGSDAYVESERKTKSYNAGQWSEIKAEEAEIFNKFAQNRHLGPDSKEAQELVKEWQDHITRYFYRCTNEILAGLGSMYTADERFMKNIDKSGDGTAAFMSKAIDIYVNAAE